MLGTRQHDATDDFNGILGSREFHFSTRERLVDLIFPWQITDLPEGMALVRIERMTSEAAKRYIPFSRADVDRPHYFTSANMVVRLIAVHASRVR